MPSSTRPTPPRAHFGRTPTADQARLPAQRHRRLLMLLAVIGLAVIGLALARHDPNPPRPDAAPATASAVATPSTSASRPTAAGSEAAGSPLAGSPGPSPRAGQGGRPVDRTSRTREGAVAAAARYATLLARMFPMPPEQAEALAADAAADSFRDRLVAGVDSSVVPLQQQAAAVPGTTTYRQSVLATKVTGIYIDAPGRPSGYGRARVDVWTLLTVAQTGRTPNGDTANATGTFTTIDLGLVWQRGAWRIEDLTELPGPTPLIDGTPATGQEFDNELQGFTPWPAP